MGEAIEAAKRIASTRDPNAFDELYGLGPDDGDYNYCDDAELVATELLRLAEPQWGEPVAEGWHWIEGINIPCYVYKNDPEDAAENGQWSFSGFDVDSDGYDHRPLNGRRVAPCVGRPRKAGE